MPRANGMWPTLPRLSPLPFADLEDYVSKRRAIGLNARERQRCS